MIETRVGALKELLANGDGAALLREGLPVLQVAGKQGVVCRYEKLCEMGANVQTRVQR